MSRQRCSLRPGLPVCGLLTQIHPALERVLGPRLDHPAVLDLLQRYPSPEKLASLGEKKLATQLSKLAPCLGKRLAADITQALSEQTFVVPGTNAAVIVLPRLAFQLITLRKQRDELTSSPTFSLRESGGGFLFR
ncbi:Mobile element protein (plasmid) [Klebsiella sp. PL-2018]|nr:Mobile element protein [Klebsiella sp. PL-2018]